MRRDQFRIGGTFFTGSGAWICTDIGTRVIVAIEQSLLRERPAGPPYEWVETVFDENDQQGCSTSPDDFEQRAPERDRRTREQRLTTNPDPYRPDRYQGNVDLAKQIAEHYGFDFHIANGTVDEYRGWKSETRAATEEELRLWRIIEMRYHAVRAGHAGGHTS